MSLPLSALDLADLDSHAIDAVISTPRSALSTTNPLDLWLSASQQLASIPVSSISVTHPPLQKIFHHAKPHDSLLNLLSINHLLPNPQSRPQPQQQQQPQPHALPHTLPTPVVQDPMLYNLTAPQIPLPRLSAVDAAKRNAEQYTMSELAKKRKAAGLAPFPKRQKSSSKSSSDEEKDEMPEQLSHKKYQKRLQKNRDSAFVSRIRRREYTKLLEQSLALVEREKESAVSAFTEMKRRFDLVCTELSAYKEAAASNIAAASNVAAFRDRHPPDQEQHPARSASVVTMFMVSLLCGVLIPDFAKDWFGIDRYTSSIPWSPARNSVIPAPAPATPNNQFLSTLHSNTPGKVWTLSANSHLSAPECQHKLLCSLRNDAVDLLGVEKSDAFLAHAKTYLEQLPTDERVKMERVLAQRNVGTIQLLARKIANHTQHNDAFSDVLQQLTQMSIDQH